MTSPPAATHAAQTGTIPLTRAADELTSGARTRLFETHLWAKLRMLVDLVVLYLASSAALFADSEIRPVAVNRWLAAAFPVVVVSVLRARSSPDEHMFGSVLDTVVRVVRAVSIATTMTIAAGSILGDTHPVGVSLRLWLFAVVYLGAARIVLLSVWRQAVRNGARATPTLVVGAGIVGEHLVKRLLGDPRYGLRPVGFLDAGPPAGADRAATRLPVLGGPGELPEAVKRSGARHVILAFSSEPDHILVDRVRECERLGVEVSLVPRLFETINRRATLDHIGGVPLVGLRSVDPRGWQFALKHAFDRSFALVALLAVSPLMLAIALAIRVSSPGPILFRQRRVGRDGREFDVLKFRTMREEGAEPRRFDLPAGIAPGGIEGEDRRTPIGRHLRSFSFDELPQFINVLRGEMSLVGPRPERPEFVTLFSLDVVRYEDRHRVKSGITGWAQVNGLRGQTSIADRVEWDNHYIQNWSLGLDFRIIVLTIAEVLRFRDSARP